MTDFSWGGGGGWGWLNLVPQGLLFFVREEGEQDLIHLVSRTVTFRLEFIQKYLAGPVDLEWRTVASCILRGAGNKVGLDDGLILIDLNF